LNESAADGLPFHLRGNYAPVRDELTAFDLPVLGTIPRELRGCYVRNAPNPKTGNINQDLESAGFS
jgi:carotenoid cleavage dioxygenase-like enzyme